MREDSLKQSELMSKYGFYLPSGVTLKKKDIDIISDTLISEIR